MEKGLTELREEVQAHLQDTNRPAAFY